MHWAVELMWLWRFEREHKNLIILLTSITGAYYLVTTPFLATILLTTSEAEYLSAFVTGLFYSYGATTPLAIASFIILVQTLNPLPIAILGALGAVISDYLIFRFARDGLLPELVAIEHKLQPEIQVLKNDLHKVEHVLHMDNHHRHHPHLNPKLRHYLAPLMAGMVLASPLPDEVAASMFGVIHYSTHKFLLYSFGLKFATLLVLGYSVASL